ncbi:hypothetical protein D4768_21310 [Rhodococcus erythropolis]|uniref:hypothetical protein n=1 Tax=Rhodococcus erythropolis TaxID=1833 RepID=UPI001F19B18E|nr:hypothetical protein [Rhodococcus erythropolis]UJC79935.1 hypothetical protein D4768_21310 [Rhodococcus erythropolis]
MTGEIRARAQASVFLTALEAEIEAVSGEIEKASSRSSRAQRASHLVAYRRYTDAEAALREKLYELHHLVDNLRVRFPGLATVPGAGERRVRASDQPIRRRVVPVSSSNRTER